MAWKVPLTVRLQVPAWHVPLDAQADPSGALPESTQTGVPVEQEMTPVRQAVVTVQAWPAVHEGPPPPPPPPHAAATHTQSSPRIRNRIVTVASLTREGGSGSRS